MTNLLEETFEAMDHFKRRPNEVFWVGTKNWSCSFVEFARIAAKIDYDASFGTEHIATDLVIVGEDWWLERGTYDGAEWWNYKTIPVRMSATPLTSDKQVCDSYKYEDEDYIPEHKVEGTQANFDRYIAGDR